MEHDTTVEAAVGDSCAETGRYLTLKNYTNYLDLKESLRGAASILPVEKYLVNTRSNFGYIRHPLANVSWGFGPDQWVPRYIISKIDDAQSPFFQQIRTRESMDYDFEDRYVPWSFMVEAVRNPRRFSYIFCLLQELILSIRPSGDCLNWFMVVLYSGYLPKILTKKKFLDIVRLYYKPETDIKAWTFIDLYEQAAEKVWG